MNTISDCRHELSAGLRKGAFTLVELLIVSAIFGTVIAAVTSCLVAGVRTWDYARKYSGVEADAALRLETVQRDIANSFRFYGIPFSGGADAVAFPCIVEMDVDDEVETLIGTIKYYYDPAKKALFRKVWAFPQGEPFDDKAEKILSGVESMVFSYFPLSAAGDAGSTWQESWNNVTNIPGALILDMSFAGENERRIGMKKTVLIPAAAAPMPEQPQQQSGKPAR